MSTEEPLLYERVARMVEAQIANGTLRGNERIPSVRSMSRTAKVSISTVVQAYRDLEREGFVEMRHGAGTFVRTVPAEKRTVPLPETVEVPPSV